MYYLIIGTNKILEGEVIEDMGKWFKLKEKNFDYSHRIDKFTPVTKKYIKKQSENVFDLIEVGDLVKTGSGKIFDVRKPYIDEGLAVVPFDIIFLNEINIVAIYKPNERGDYIKVWEVKEND